MNELVFGHFSSLISPWLWSLPPAHMQPPFKTELLTPHMPEMFTFLEICTCYSLCGRPFSPCSPVNPFHPSQFSSNFTSRSLPGLSETGSPSFLLAPTSPHFHACVSSPLHQNPLTAGIDLRHLRIPMPCTKMFAESMNGWWNILITFYLNHLCNTIES